MGSVLRARRARNKHRANGLVLLMILSTFAAFSTPVQASIDNDDVAIISAQEPVGGIYYDMSDIVDWTPQITVENQYSFGADSRTLEVKVCGGDYTHLTDCPTSSILKESTTQSPNLNPAGSDGDTAVVNFYSFLWFVDSGDISTYAGTFTVLFRFTHSDDNSNNDHLSYTVVIVDNLVDLVVKGHDVDTSAVYNSNSPISANLDIQTRSWPDTQNFTAGWSMHLVNPMVAESQDCVLWDMNYTGQGNVEGTGELIIHTATHYDTQSDAHHSPFDIQVIITNTTNRIFGNIAASGTQFGSAHTVEVSATLNGSEIYSEDWSFTGDGTQQTQMYNTEFANGTICFTVKMTVDDIEVAQDSHELSDYSGTVFSVDIPLPDIVAPYAGNFEVRANVNGTFMDPNLHNDLVTFDLTVNDTTDLWIREVVPARGTTTYVQQGGQYLAKYPYGQQSIRVVSGNIGWVTAEARVEVNLYNLVNFNLEAGPYTCTVTLTPGEESQCDFDFSSTGAFVLNASITTLDGNIDALPSDNWFEQSIIVDFGTINPTIASPVITDVFETGENILAVASVDPQAPMPLNYTWKMNFMEVLGYGPITNITLPMGEWIITLYVTDEAGNLEIGTQPIRILNRVEFTSLPHVSSGMAISTYSMEFDFDEPQLPPPGIFYPSAYNKGKEPLAMFNMSMESPYGLDIDVDSIEAWLNLDTFLPANIDRTTVELLHLLDWNDTVTEEMVGGNSFTIGSNDSLHLVTTDSTGGSFLILGVLDPIDVNPSNLTIVLQMDGQVKIAWENEGDYGNPYFGGWKIFRKEVFRFSYPFDSLSQFNSATQGYGLLEVSAETSSWQDPNFWEEGTCLSYLVMAQTRAGMTDWRFGNVTNAVWSSDTERMVVDQVCVDNSNPVSTVNDLSAVVLFDNNSSPKVHSVNVSWTWPAVGDEGPLSWNLYRSEVVLPSVTFMEPLVSGMQGAPGEVAWYNNDTENSLRESIKVDQVYYYVLIPFDSVGNSDYLVRDDNAVKIEIVDQYWDYHLPPPPPAPEPDPSLPGIGPSPWYGRLLDDINSGPFQQAGIVCFALMIMNLLLVPLLINKYKEIKVKLKRRKSRGSQIDDDLGEFFD